MKRGLYGLGIFTRTVSLRQIWDCTGT
jgi:hypothetical protein